MMWLIKRMQGKIAQHDVCQCCQWLYTVHSLFVTNDIEKYFLTAFMDNKKNNLKVKCNT